MLVFEHTVIPNAHLFQQHALTAKVPTLYSNLNLGTQ
jgi:hypothetical protein